MRWSEAITLEFVKMYLKHDCLWNPSHPGYKLKYQRDKAYADICSEFKDSTMKSLTIPEVKMKIKNLRTTYVQQVHKILQKSSPDSIYEPSLIWFQEMDRCLKHIPTNRHLASYTTQDAPDVDTSCQIWVGQELQNNNNDENPDPLISNSEDDYESPKTEDSLSPIKKEKPLSPLMNKKNKKKKLKHRNHIDYSKDSNFETTKEDEFDIYGKYIASQLRKMDLQKAIRLQLEIQSLVSEARISDITSD
ncbi:uncharacterized protein LOC125069914 [Vanessa atalanta]|uniref:uncharacterized protein LOC125069914 n=1 Tax=Vanessa atalanta TaxID=42275 RepID=UPI001FCD0EEB|nr:uncharacterized protein LOC125069914 [Vanessa atalanta]